ncbi:DUF6134 family protein [Lacinutrix algicola]|uniref:DUF6134 family protein n=1 Tax=Lacinutrix algicola TaxID=342954 RepID=UPI0006E31324|nr:DUF6134 family protein [Lacinutrix algicola]
MIKNLVIILFLVSLGGDSKTSVETLYFDIIHKDKVIGSLKATKTIKDSTTFYKSSTTIETRIIKEIRVNYKYDVTFKNNLLETSNVDITVNEKPHAKTDTKKKGTDYKIVKNENEVEIVKDAISFATVQLYFKEPKNVDSCYSEQDGSFNTIKALGNHSYKKTNSKGRENIYYYKKGALKNATIDGGLITFEIVTRKP